MSEYPEHDKLRACRDKSQLCGEFLEWLLEEKGWEPPEAAIRLEAVLAEFFEIDQCRLEDEKVAMLSLMRSGLQ